MKYHFVWQNGIQNGFSVPTPLDPTPICSLKRRQTLPKNGPPCQFLAPFIEMADPGDGHSPKLADLQVGHFRESQNRSFSQNLHPSIRLPIGLHFRAQYRFATPPCRLPASRV
jgi:hypothetical protein